MNTSEFLEFSTRELNEIETLKNELKTSKLQNFFIDLLEHNNLEYVQQLVEKKIDFYSQLELLAILKKSIEIITSNIFRPSAEKAIQNIKNIQAEQYIYIKELFSDAVVKVLDELERDFLIEDGLTSPQIEGSPYHKKILKIAQNFLLENPQYVDKFKHLNLKEFTVLRQVISLENKFPPKNIIEKRMKI